MKSFKKLFALVLSVSLISTAITAGTIAYLQDEDSDVNVMTLGNVKIEQIEQERNKNGELVDFTQAKPAYPAVGDIEWDEENLLVNGVGYKVFDDGLKNVVDKVVTVKNTGKSDAYVRTIVAIEAPDYDPQDLIHINYNDKGVKISSPILMEINGTKYVTFVFTYDEALGPKEVSAPSLMQLFLDSKADNEFCGKFGETWEVLVASQAVQVEGFADAQTALDTAFGAITAANHPWVEGVEVPFIVYTVEDMRAAMKTPGVKMILGNDIIIDDDKGTGYALYAKYDCTIDLNGKTLSADMPGKEFYGIVYALNGAEVNFVENGNIEVNGGVGYWIFCTGANGDTEVNIYGGNWTQSSLDFNASNDNFAEGLYANRAGKINVYGGTFNWENFEKYTVNESREGIVTIYGGTFINFDPRVSHDSDGSYVAEGYEVIEETQSNGDVWYKVVK